MKLMAIVLLLVFAIIGISASSSPTSYAVTNINDFTIDHYQIDYYLDRSNDGHSTLKTVESIYANFPDYDQNHGIERAIPSSYDGHTTHLRINSVVDQNNHAYSYSTYKSNGNTVVRIGDANRYVHGFQTYKLTYIQQDTTKYFSNTKSDEFYWDTNGTEWRVPISSLAVRLHVSGKLLPSATGHEACYIGFAASTNSCTIVKEGDTYSVGTTNLEPGENITIAIGFKPKTFASYKSSVAERITKAVFLLATVTAPLGVLLIVWFGIRYQMRSNRTSELKTIVPEYIPPADTSVTTSAAISQTAVRSFSAQLIDFAVRHYIRIYETRKKSFLRSAKYELEIIKDIGDLKQEEQELLNDIFSSTRIGTKLDMSTMRKNYSLAKKLNDNPSKLKKAIAGAYGLRARDDKQSHWFKRAAFIILIAAVLTVSPFLLVAAIVSFVLSIKLKPLTDKGLELARYLKGLEMYIKVAETDRLRMLQSPEGAIKVGVHVDGNNPKQLIKLYERVLPYAILFGQEKEWNKRLGDYYQSANESPNWYSSNNAVFNAAVFSSAISNFSSAATYSNPSSSSSGGSGGGGSSGGGGGGGGGGGW